MSYQRSRILASACACVLGMATANVWAQAAPDKVTELEEVVVTGSYFTGTPTDSAIPVEALTLEDLRNMGTPTNIDLVKSMTEVGQVAGETNRYNSFPIGAATVNLRNLGSRFTLVLFNGRRFPEQYSVAVGRFNNIAWIPNAPIGSVETLKAGGAVTYGADAVGGVVNYLTRKNYEGLEIKADYRYIEDDSGDYTADLLWGKKFGNSDFLISAGYQHRGILRSIDRDWARRPYLENDNALAWATAGSPGSYTFQTQRTSLAQVITPATPYQSITTNAALSPGLSLYTGTNQMSGTGTIRDPNCSALGGFAGWSATPTPICFFQLAQFEKLVEETNQYNVYAEFNHLFDSGMKYHAEVMAYYQDVPDITAHPSDGPIVYPLQAGSATGAAQATVAGSAYFVPGTNPAVGQFLNSLGGTAYTAQQIADITSGNGRAALSGLTWRPFGNGGNPMLGAYDVQHNWTKFYRAVNQLSGDLPEFLGTKLKWDVAVTYDHVVDRKEIHDVVVDRLQAALNGLGGPNCTGTTPGANGCLYFNPFSSAIPKNYYTGAVNPGFVGTGTFAGYTAGLGLQNNLDLIRSFYELIWLERTYEDVTVDPVVSGEIGVELPGGPMKLAVGAQFRYRSEETQLDDWDNRTINPCATLGVQTCVSRGGAMAFQRSQTVLGAPADLLAPTANGHTNRKFPAAAVFFETELPLLETLTVNASGRYEKFYSDITDRDNQVFVPAASVKWQALDWAALRVSGGKTFSQVNPPAEAPATVTSNVLNATYGVTTNNANYSNLDVQPMKGKYFDVGFLFNAGGFVGSVDYFVIAIDDYTRTMTTTNVISALVMPGQSPGNTNLINCSSPLLNPQAAFGGRAFVELATACSQGTSTLASALGSGRINYFGTTDETNSGTLKTSGIDLNARYHFDDVVGGQLTPSVDVSYILKWYLGDFIVGGVPVTPGYDGVGYRNTSANRNGQGVPEYRATFGVNYRHGNHNVNLAVRYMPSVIDDNAALFNETGARNANVGNASGATTAGGACTGSYATDTNPTISLGNLPAGAGTGLYGQNPTIAAGAGGAANVIGYCAFQNYSMLTGQTVPSQTNVDLTYRVLLPAETDVTFTVYNLLDEEPVFTRNAINYDAGFGSPLGRNFKLQIAKRF